MKDFEVHPIGTATEIKLSRALANEIEQITQQYGNVVPHSVLQKYYELRSYYQKQMEMETL